MNYLVLSKIGLATAKRLQQHLGGVIHATAKAGDGTDIRPVENVGDSLRSLFRSGEPLIALCAAGIVIRHLAAVLTDKHVDAPVLAIAENGSAVVPLIGGHHGANQLSQQIGDILSIIPAITTASDALFGVALDSTLR